MQFDAADPHWVDRDRFVLLPPSILLYSMLYLTGVKDMTPDELKRFRQIDSRTAGTPNTSMPTVSRRRPAHSDKALQTRWASPSPSTS
jgi:transketolase